MTDKGAVLEGTQRRAAVRAGARTTAMLVFLLVAARLTMGPTLPVAHSQRKEAHDRDRPLYHQHDEQQQRQAAHDYGQAEEIELDVDDMRSLVHMVIGRAVASLAVTMRESSLFARDLERAERNLERARHRLLTNSSASGGGVVVPMKWCVGTNHGGATVTFSMMHAVP